MKAEEIKVINVTLPSGDTLELVLLREEETGLYLAVDASYVEQEVDDIVSPYGHGVLSLSSDDPEMMTYTAFCRSVLGEGTTWIDTLEGPADDVDAIKCEARAKCALDWCVTQEEVVCIGLAKGDVSVVDWEDEVTDPPVRYFKGKFAEDDAGWSFVFRCQEALEQSPMEYVEALKQSSNVDDVAEYSEISERQFTTLAASLPLR